MTSAEVRAIVEGEIEGDSSGSNAHAVDLQKCLVPPRKAVCRNSFPALDDGGPLQLWIVLEETPGRREGYLIVFDEQRRTFGLASWDGESPVFIGFHSTFLNTLQGM